MNERMTRKELTEEVKDIRWKDKCLDTRLNSIDKKITMLGEVIGLLEAHLGVIATQTEAVPSKLVLKKVRKPYTKKQ